MIIEIAKDFMIAIAIVLFLEAWIQLNGWNIGL